MEWYNYLACFFAGAFLANAVPHFIHGVSGDKFPSPFAKPPGKGLSTASVNVWWSFFNFIAGFLLFNAGKITTAQPLTWALFFAGALAMSLMLGYNFQRKDKE